MKTAFLMLLDTLGSTFRMLLYFGTPSPFAENGIADVLKRYFNHPISVGVNIHPTEICIHCDHRETTWQ